MHFIFKIVFLLCVNLILSACVTGKHGSEYVSFVDPLTAEGVQLLLDSEEPTIIRSQNIEQDKAKYLNLNFVLVGEAVFKSYEEPRYLKVNLTSLDREEAKAFRQAKNVGATHVVYYRKQIDEIFKSWLVPPEFEHVFENHTVYMIESEK